MFWGILSHRSMMLERRSLTAPRPGIGAMARVKWTPDLAKEEKKCARDGIAGLSGESEGTTWTWIPNASLK